MRKLFGSSRSKVERHPLFIIVTASLLVHAVVFFIFLARGEAAFLRSNDSPLYLTAARNLQQYHRFAEYDGHPSQPSMFTMPGYAVMLAATTAVLPAPWFTALLQNVLSLMTVVVLYRMLRMVGSGRLAWWAAFWYGVEPFSSYQANLIMTDTLFTFLMMLGFYAYLRAWQGNSMRWLLLAAVWLGLASYVRLIGIFFAGLLALWWLGEAIVRRWSWRRAAAVVVFLTVIFGLLAPWAVRNGRTFGLWKLSTESNFVLYLFHANQAIALREHRSPQEVRGELITHLDALPKEEAVRDRFLGRRAREILRENWRWYLPVWAVKIVPFFVQSGWRDIVEIAGFPSSRRPVDISGALLRGQWSQAIAALSSFDLPTLSHLLGTLVWAAITLLAAIAPVLAWRHDRQRWPFIALSGATILLFAMLTSPISHARYRQPVQPLIIALAMYATLELKVKNQKLKIEPGDF